MARSRASAKKAGSSFERLVADYLKNVLDNSAIDRRVRNGVFDRGDIANVTTHNGKDVVVECKDYAGRVMVTEWLREAETERDNADAAIGVVVCKKRGTTDPAEQIVLMDLKTFAFLLRGENVSW